MEEHVGEFYEKLGDAYVVQKVNSLEELFNRRKGLFYHLGIPSALLKGKRILELGSGDGFNSLSTLSCEPSQYMYVEANPKVLETSRHLTGTYKKETGVGTDLLFENSRIEDFTTDISFDLIICEAVIPFQQKDPRAIFRKVLSLAGPGAVVVVTCGDAVSSVSDLMRRLMALMLMDGRLPLPEQIESIEPFFAEHFRNLPGMTKTVTASLYSTTMPIFGKLFSIADAIDCAEDVADVFGASPRFCTDWRWYKDLSGRRTGSNDTMREGWRKNVHSFIDYQHIFPARSVEDNMALYKSAQAFFDMVIEYQNSKADGSIAEAVIILRDIAARIATINAEGGITAQRITDGAAALELMAADHTYHDCGSFTHFFGRGQQHLSFMKV